VHQLQVSGLQVLLSLSGTVLAIQTQWVLHWHKL